MKKKAVIAAFLAAAAGFAVYLGGKANVDETGKGEFTVKALKTEGQINPLGIDQKKPEFSWQLDSAVTGKEQAGYRITARKKGGEQVWDSGYVNSRHTCNIFYEGAELIPCTEYEWTVAVTDTAKDTVLSEPAWFETSFLDGSAAPWKGAKWIGARNSNYDAASAALFQLEAMMDIEEGNTASVPANTRATLYLAVPEETAVMLDKITGVSFKGMGERNGQMAARFELLSGTYTFDCDPE